MAVPNKPRPRDLCPSCLEQGVEADLLYNPGGRFSHYCNNGHSWEDRETLSNALLAVSRKLREKQEALKPVEPPAPDPKQSTDEPTPTVSKIQIDPIDKERMQLILGADFTDSSSLFGLIFAMNEVTKDLREKVQRAEARVMVSSQVRRIGGDVPITVNIPERHVESIKDIAEAGGMSMDRYMQARIEEALDNMWFV